MKSFKLFFLVITTLLSLAVSGYSQDTIVKFSEEVIQAKIIEITPSVIKYKKFDFQDGPLYVLDKSEIKMIKFSNGVKEEFEKVKTSKNNAVSFAPSNKIENFGNQYRYQNGYLNERQMHTILMQTKDKKIQNLITNAKQSKALQYVGFLGIPLGLVALVQIENGSIVRSVENDRDLIYGGISLIGAIACPIASGVFKHRRTQSNKEALKLYNEQF